MRMRDAISHWLQREDEALLYTPQGEPSAVRYRLTLATRSAMDGLLEQEYACAEEAWSPVTVPTTLPQCTYLLIRLGEDVLPYNHPIHQEIMAQFCLWCGTYPRGVGACRGCGIRLAFTS